MKHDDFHRLVIENTTVSGNVKVLVDIISRQMRGI
jgi:hypothetical protein